MQEKEDIAGLIKSMSKSEKRYFKLIVLKNIRGKSSHYIKLFDLIDKTGSAEKKVIQKLYRDENFMKKGFSVYKTWLYEQILKSLRSYHSKRNVDDKIMELIRDAKILYDKTLYPDAGKALKKAKSLACKYEKHTLLPEIIRWQKKILNTWSIYGKTSENDIIRLFEEEKLSGHKMDNINEYWKQRALLFLSYRINGMIRAEEDIDRYHAFINVPILKNEKLALSYEAKIGFYGINAFYFSAVNNMEESYNHNKKRVALMEAHPHLIEDDPANYSNAFHNLLISTKGLDRYKEFFNMISRVKSFLRKFQLRSSVLLRICVLEFETYLEIGQFKKATLLLPEVEGVFTELTNKDEMLELFFNMNKAILYFGNKDYNKALAYLNVVMNDNRTNLRQDIYSFARIFQLIIHFEKENRDLLPYLVKSVYRYLMQRKQLHKVEDHLIRFIRIKLSKINTKSDQTEAFKALKEELVEICNDSMEAIFLELFDFVSWLESKIENRPFEEILQEKSGYVLI